MPEVHYAAPHWLAAFRQTLDIVARERLYIEMLEAPELDQLELFQTRMIAADLPVYYALEGQQVLGWADICPPANPRLAHRGYLGMGLLPEARGQGLGQQLLAAALNHARTRTTLEKVELLVFTSNVAAIGLYRKFGFTEIGIIRQFRKLDGVYFDCLEMELFLRH